MSIDLLRKSLKGMLIASCIALAGAIYINRNPHSIAQVVDPLLQSQEVRGRIIAEMQQRAQARVRIQIHEALDKKAILKFLWGGKLFLYQYIEDRTVEEILGLIASEHVFAKLIVPASPLSNLDKFRIGIYWQSEGKVYFLASLKAKWNISGLDVDLSEAPKEEEGLKVYVDYLSRYVELIATSVYEEEIKADIGKLRSSERKLSAEEEIFLEQYSKISQEMRQYIAQRDKTLLSDILEKLLILEGDVGKSIVRSGNTRFKQSLFSLLSKKIRQTEDLLKKF